MAYVKPSPPALSVILIKSYHTISISYLTYHNMHIPNLSICLTPYNACKLETVYRPYLKLTLPPPPTLPPYLTPYLTPYITPHTLPHIPYPLSWLLDGIRKQYVESVLLRDR